MRVEGTGQRRPVRGEHRGILPSSGRGRPQLDELHGRPLHTSLPAWQLVLAAVLGLGGALGLGVLGLYVVRGWFFVFILVGVTVVVGYNLELFGGRLHTRAVIVLSWEDSRS